jgi:hypothetical protein
MSQEQLQAGESLTQDEDHPIRRTSKQDGSETWVTIELAARKVANYTGQLPETARAYLIEGSTLETISFFYKLN